MSRYIFSKNNRWYISEVFDPSDSKLQEKASYYTLTDDVTGPYYAVGTSDSASIGVSYVPVVEPAGADVTLGVVDSLGRFQALKFNGTQASNSGSALVVQNYKTWNSTLPAPQPSGGSMDFYKCSYVNSDSWGGYKAVHDPVTGIYSFESNSTSGLSWGGGFRPESGNVYTDGALVRASLFEGIPTAGLVFHAPLNTSSATAATGQTMTETGTITFGTVQGIPCASLDGYSYLTGSASLTSGNAPFTMSLWLKSNTDQEVHVAFCMGTLGVKTAVFTGIRYSTIYGAMFCYSDEGGGVTVDTSVWIHLCYVWDGDYMKTYANGHYVRQYQFGTVDVQSGWKIGGNTWADEDWNGYIAAVRVYGRALNTSEIAMLAAEFTPSA